jgi:hypothetical protein
MHAPVGAALAKDDLSRLKSRDATDTGQPGDLLAAESGEEIAAVG